jgi:H+-transporting ATPase
MTASQIIPLVLTALLAAVPVALPATHARPSPYPNAWRIRNLTLAAIPLALVKLSYCIGVVATGWYWFRLSADQMRTLTFTMLVFAGQAVVYVLRERGPFWASRPAPVMLAASGANVAIALGLASFGLVMTPLPRTTVIGLALATLAFALALDLVKRGLFARLRID